MHLQPRAGTGPSLQARTRVANDAGVDIVNPQNETFPCAADRQQRSITDRAIPGCLRSRSFQTGSKDDPFRSLTDSAFVSMEFYIAAFHQDSRGLCSQSFYTGRTVRPLPSGRQAKQAQCLAGGRLSPDDLKTVGHIALGHRHSRYGDPGRNCPV